VELIKRDDWCDHRCDVMTGGPMPSVTLTDCAVAITSSSSFLPLSARPQCTASTPPLLLYIALLVILRAEL